MSEPRCAWVVYVPCPRGCGRRKVRAAAQCSHCHAEGRRAPVVLTAAVIRPREIAFHGGTLALGVHDDYFLARYKVLRQQMFDCHPDRRPHTRVGLHDNTTIGPISTLRQPQAIGAFVLATKILARWLVVEDRWYAGIGWEAPPVSRPSVVGRTRAKRAPLPLTP